MLFGLILFAALFIILTYVLSWIRYFNSLDPRLGQSTWRWSYDYPVIGARDFSDLDDKEFVRKRRIRNRTVSFMYWNFFIGFTVSMYLISDVLMLSLIHI